MRHVLVYIYLSLLNFLEHRLENITNWSEYYIWDHGPTCIVGLIISLGPRSHSYCRSDYLRETTIPLMPVSECVEHILASGLVCMCCEYRVNRPAACLTSIFCGSCPGGTG